MHSEALLETARPKVRVDAPLAKTLHAIHHQVLWSSESVCVQYVCNSGEVIGQYNITLDNTKPPELQTLDVELNRHKAGPVPQTVGQHLSAIGSMHRVS